MSDGRPPVPDSWSWQRLSAIAQIRGGVTKGRKLAGRQTVLVPYLRVANVQDGFLDLTEVKQIEALPEDQEKYRLLPGDVLFTEGGDRDKLGRGAVWRGGIPNCIHQNHIFRARVFTEVATPEFVSLASRSEFSRAYFFGSASQTVNLASINLTVLSALPLPLPPLAEQKRIVAKLEALLAKVDACQARLARIPTLLKRFRQSVLATACSGRLTADWREEHPAAESEEYLPSRAVAARAARREQSGRQATCATAHMPDAGRLPGLPAGWAWVPLGLMGQSPSGAVQTGPFGALLHKEQFTQRGVPVVAVGNLTGMGFTTEGLYFVSAEKAELLARFDVRAGDVLFARSGATLGKVCVAPPHVRDWRMTGHILRARLNRDLLLPDFCVFALRGDPAVTAQVFGSAQGTTRPGYNTALLESIALPVPPLPEQHEIVRRVEALFALADRLEARFTQAKAQVDHLTQALLAKAFRGELVPQDPNDEPAGVLLGRLRDQGADLGGRPTRRGRTPRATPR